MKDRQLADRIGNMDSLLVQEAGCTPNYATQRRKRGLRRALLLAATAALMAVSFTVGALAFSTEKVVERPLRQETIRLEEIGLTLILPDGWRDLYQVEEFENGQGCMVYVKSIWEQPEGMGGILFYVDRSFDYPMTPAQLEEAAVVPSRYLFSTAEGTYTIAYASDVEYDPYDPEESELYLRMREECSQIRFVVDNVLAD